MSTESKQLLFQLGGCTHYTSCQPEGASLPTPGGAESMRQGLLGLTPVSSSLSFYKHFIPQEVGCRPVCGVS